MNLLKIHYAVMCCVLVCVQVGQAQSPVNKGQNEGWRWRSGVSMRQVQGPDVSIGASVTTLDLLSAFGPEVPIAAPPSAGNNLSVGDRTYTDGYVNDEGGFANTSDFGYASAGQYNSGANTLTYTIAPTDPLAGSAYVFSSNAVATSVGAGFDDEIAPSLNFEIDRLIDRRGYRSGLVLGFGLFASDFRANFGTGFNGSATADRYGVGVTDVYDTSGAILFNAPYDGGGGGFGQPTIPNQPSSRTITTSLLGTDTMSASSMVELDWEMLATYFDCGYRWEWEHDRYSWDVSAGSTLHIMGWDAKHLEQMTQIAVIGGLPQPATIASANSSDNGVDLLIGAYLQAGISRLVGSSSSIGLYGRYDLSQGMETRVGPSQISQSMNGCSVGLCWSQQF